MRNLLLSIPIIEKVVRTDGAEGGEGANIVNEANRTRI